MKAKNYLVKIFWHCFQLVLIRSCGLTQSTVVFTRNLFWPLRPFTSIFCRDPNAVLRVCPRNHHKSHATACTLTCTVAVTLTITIVSSFRKILRNQFVHPRCNLCRVEFSVHAPPSPKPAASTSQTRDKVPRAPRQVGHASIRPQNMNNHRGAACKHGIYLGANITHFECLLLAKLVERGYLFRSIAFPLHRE